MLAVLSLALISCSKDEEEAFLPVSKSIVGGQCTTTSFTASITGSFSGVDMLDLALGKQGVIYCVKSDDVEVMFKDWLEGKDNSEVKMFDSSNSTGESMQCTINGLAEDTEYNYSLYLQKRDGSREISSVSSFQTKPFNPDIEEVTLDGIECFVAFVGGSVKMDSKDVACCETGIVFSERQKGTVDNSVVYKLNGAARTRINGLEPDKEYYCRFYVKYPSFAGQSAYKYGPEKLFRTKIFNEVAVDMGLPSGTLWALYNVGADKPEDYGEYYAWGEIQPKASYTWNNYKWRDDNKYNTDTMSVNLSQFKYIQPEDDAANYYWGGNWSMLSNADIDELNEYCYSYVDTINGVRGSMFVSEINGNAFFIPYTGVKRDNTTVGSGTFWVNFNRDLFFADGQNGYWCWKAEAEWRDWTEFKSTYNDILGRQSGRTIRPVYHKEQ